MRRRCTTTAALVYFDQFLDNMGYADNWKEKEVRDTVAAATASVSG